MAQLNKVIEDPLSEMHASNRRPSKARISLPPNSVLFSHNGSHTSIGIRENNSPARQHRQSSRYSFPRGGYDRRPIRYENTYRMEPSDDHKLDLVRIRRVATSVIETAMVGYKYVADQASEFTEVLADRLRSQMKQLPFPRYKIVTHVSVGQKKGQGVHVFSRCMWDLKLDRHITITKQTSNAYINVTIFFVYTE